MARRGNNITKRKDGRYEARYIKGRDKNNKIIYGYLYAYTYKEVREKQINILKEQHKKIIKDTFNYVIDNFLKDKQKQVKESTLAHYNELIDRYIRPNFGNIKTYLITRELINDITLEKYHHLSNKTVKDILVLLREILLYNDIDIKITYPKTEDKKKKILSKVEQEKLERYIFSHFDNLTLGILLSLYMGLRIGEVCALKWNDIDFDNKILKVRKTIIRIKSYDGNKKTKVVITSPKSNKSKRDIPIPDILIPYLEKIRSSNDNYLLTNNKNFIEPRLLRIKFHNIIKSLNIKCSFHNLRHTFATNCIEAGFDIKTLSEILGHSSVRTTLSIYIHPNLDLKTTNMNKLHFINK